MILTFSKDRFVDDIKAGRKIHTIRTDAGNRWKPGMAIHFWRGNPRNVHAKEKPYCFREGECTGVEKITIWRSGTLHGFRARVWRGDVQVDLDDDKIEGLCQNDGLTAGQFRMWFVPPGTDSFTGRIIHWTDKRYAH